MPPRTEITQRASWVLWIVLLLGVPITTFPLVSKLGGKETPVAPFALIPLAILTIVWLAPYLVRGGKVPAAAKPLIAFAAASVLSAGMASFLPLLPYKGQTPLGREVRALATLAMGLGFYLTACLLPDSDDRRRWSLQAIYLGGALTLGWASVQGWVALSGADHVPLIITRLHQLISVRDPILDRVSGFAFEPSWLGNQLMVLYVPLLLASVLTRQSVFPFRRGWFTVEMGMLVWGLVILALTRSRISQVSLLTVACVGAAWLGWRALTSLEHRWIPTSPAPGSLPRMALGAFKVLVLAGVLLGLVGGASSAVGRADPRLWALGSIDEQLPETRRFYPNDEIYAVGDRLAFAERLVYWTAAFRVFGLHPILGVGPGNSGFLFEETLPEYGLRLTEIRAQMREPAFGFPNPKNLYARILAETGILGFSAFGAWMVLMAAGSLVLFRSGHGFLRYLGLAGLVMLLAQLVEGFSLDTYALPQLWILLGLCTGALWRSGIPHTARLPDASGRRIPAEAFPEAQGRTLGELSP